MSGRAHRETRLTPFAQSLLGSRYLRKDEHGVIETPDQLWRRVARCVAAAERHYGGDKAVQYWEERFYELLSECLFLPNSPTLFNAGRKPQMLSACFVLLVPDSMEGILQVTKEAGLIQKSGGGVGFDFSAVRARGATVQSTAGVASGPVSFMRGINAWAQVIKQGGLRRAANMAVLPVHHPDAEEFVQCKTDNAELNAFNLSVGITNEFMAALSKGEMYCVIDPQKGKEVKRRDPGKMWDLICENAWKCAEPGLLFLGTINAANPTPHIGRIEATNPCGEQPLLPYESCNLGSLDLVRMLHNGEIDWEKLRDVTKMAVRFLDDVIEVNQYPLRKIERMTKGNRKIGLGVMAFADLLYDLGIPYDSDEAVELAERLMLEVSRAARKASEKLAEERGPFPNFQGSIYDRAGGKKIRNATRTTIAPTGTLSLIAGVSHGIEPNFGLCFEREVNGKKVLITNPVFDRVAKDRKFWRPDLMEKVFRRGNIREIEGIPDDVKRVFVTALEIDPEWHVRVQAAFQKHGDNSVSKTVNLPSTATVQDVDKVYRLAFELGCKGITVYRDRSRPNQVITAARRSAPTLAKKLSPRPRPFKTKGETFKFRTGCGSLFVTVNKDEEGPCEVFANLGKAGGCAAQTEATCRAISIGLRAGVDPKEHIEQLKNIRCLSTVARRKTNKDITVVSCADAIAAAIKEVVGEDSGPMTTFTADKCPDCGHALRREMGCNVCDNCSYSKCG